MHDTTALERSLAALVSDELGAICTVLHRGTLSAGATRQTHDITIGTKGKSQRAIAQLRTLESKSYNLPVSAERALLDAAYAVGVSVAKPIASGRLEDPDAEVLITRHHVGETIPRKILRSLAKDQRSGPALIDELGAALARLHRIAPSDLPATAIDQLPTIEPDRYLDHLGELLDQLPTYHPSLRFGIAYLRDRAAPEPTTSSIVHGDLRLGNILVGLERDRKQRRLEALLDWELGHLGHPMEDLAWLCLRTWRFGNDDQHAGGLATEDELRDAYERAGGSWDQDAFIWWSIARTIWWGCGLAGQAATYLDGSSQSLVHAASGRRVVELEYDLLSLIGDDR